MTSVLKFEGAEETHCTTDYERPMNPPFSTTSQTFGPIGQISQINYHGMISSKIDEISVGHWAFKMVSCNK